MDRVKDKKKVNPKKIAAMAASVVVVLGAFFYFNIFNFGDPSVSKEKIRIGVVKRGTFDVLVSGNGVVSAKDPDWVVAKVSGQVLTATIKSGDQIKKGEVIAQLANEDLISSFTKSESDLRAQKADFSVLEVTLNSQLSEHESNLVKAELDYKQAFAIYDALNQLKGKGVVPIPALEYANAKIKVEQMSGLVDIAKIKLASFKKIMHTQIEAFKFRLASVEEENVRIKKRVEDLRIVASKDGIIQNLNLKVGQAVSSGDLVSQIIDPSSAYVTLNIPATHAFKVLAGQAVEIEINKRKIKGEVHRVDPNVKGTTVEVDVYFSEQVNDAKVGMFVNGTVSIKSIPNSLYVEIPSHVSEGGPMPVFVVSKDEGYAHLKIIKSGLVSTNYLQILDGLNVGEKVILSELQNFNSVTNLRLK